MGGWGTFRCMCRGGEERFVYGGSKRPLHDDPVSGQQYRGRLFLPWEWIHLYFAGLNGCCLFDDFDKISCVKNNTR